MKGVIGKWEPLTYLLLGIFNSLFAVTFLLDVALNFATSGFYLALLLPLFIGFASFLYVFLSLLFGYQVLVKKQKIKGNFKDWVKVNALVAIIYATLQLVSLVIVLATPALVQKMSLEYKMTTSFFYSMGIILMVCSVTIILHVLMTFRAFRLNRSYFQ
jgi:formate-dependent nitrite reductase membrane component NrfD